MWNLKGRTRGGADDGGFQGWGWGNGEKWSKGADVQLPYE